MADITAFHVALGPSGTYCFNNYADLHRKASSSLPEVVESLFSSDRDTPVQEISCLALSDSRNAAVFRSNDKWYFGEHYIWFDNT